MRFTVIASLFIGLSVAASNIPRLAENGVGVQEERRKDCGNHGYVSLCGSFMALKVLLTYFPSLSVVDQPGKIAQQLLAIAYADSDIQTVIAVLAVMATVPPPTASAQHRGATNLLG